MATWGIPGVAVQIIGFPSLDTKGQHRCPRGCNGGVDAVFIRSAGAEIVDGEVVKDFQPRDKRNTRNSGSNADFCVVERPTKIPELEFVQQNHGGRKMTEFNRVEIAGK